VRFVLARDALADKTLSPDQRLRLAEQLRRILRDEAASARDLFAIARQDSRIGFEASNHYYYLPQDLIEKVINCRYLLDRWDVLRP
jgi:hypothetical protein